MEIALQGESRGIVYEGYDKAFIQCIFEEGGVQGRNERYEFRCDSHLQCCGRVCCIPEEATIPLWLMIIFVVLALLLLLAILGTLAWLCAKKFKNRPKKPKFVPSPMEESNLKTPQPVKIVQRSDTEISRPLFGDTKEAAPLNPQRAQLAFYRPFVPDPMEEVDMPKPLRAGVSYHSIAEISQSKMPQMSSVEQPKGKQAQRMYTRPGFDNVPSY